MKRTRGISQGQGKIKMTLTEKLAMAACYMLVFGGLTFLVWASFAPDTQVDAFLKFWSAV